MAKIVEAWKPVAGYETSYEVSSLGNVRRICGGKGARAGHLLRPKRHVHGYLAVVLCLDNNRSRFLIHRLVASAFFGPSNGRDVNHKNGIKDDNRTINLEWVSKMENARHALHVLNKRKKLTPEVVREMRTRYATGTVKQADLAKEFGVSQCCVSSVIHGRILVSDGGPICTEDKRKRAHTE
jgi:DNA-binding transcriptional regulator YiaG